MPKQRSGRFCRLLTGLDNLGTDDIRTYQLHLLREKKVGVSIVRYRVAAGVLSNREVGVTQVRIDRP